MCFSLASCIDPQLVLLFDKGLLLLFLVEHLLLDVEDLAKLLVTGCQGLHHVKILDAHVPEHLAPGPDVLGEVVVEHQRECFLTLELPVQIALKVVHLCLHATIRFQEEVWVSLKEVAQVNARQIGSILGDQIKLLSNHVLTVLQGKLGLIND